MVTQLVRWYGRLRSDLVRLRPFDRRPRIKPGRLPNLTPEQQVVYDRACRFLRDSYIPTTGGKGR